MTGPFRVSVFGTGHVGLVTGVCLAEVGHKVICADPHQDRISQLNKGITSIHEPHLQEKLLRNLEADRLAFTADLEQAIHFGDILLVAVGTPETSSGAADLGALLSLCETIGKEAETSKTIIVKSTVPVGTHREIQRIFRQHLQKRSLSISLDVVSNPEFLREGAGIEETFRPTRIIAGSDSPAALSQTRALYARFWNEHRPFLEMSPESAELSKYAANSMLAARVSIMNEFAELSAGVGADIEDVRIALGWDPRIGAHFLHSGLGFGGPCLPKDLKALLAMSEGLANMGIMRSVLERNHLQKKKFLELMGQECGSLEGRKIAFWGLSFKPGTDDTREAAALDLIRDLKDCGARISAYDPLVSKTNPDLFRGDDRVRMETDPYECLRDAKALCLITEWNDFANPDFVRMKSLMAANPVLFDGRNLYDPSAPRAHGFRYRSFGRR